MRTFILSALAALSPLIASACSAADDLTSGIVMVEELRDLRGRYNTFETHMRRLDGHVLASRRDPQLRRDQWHNLELGGLLGLLEVRASGANRADGTFPPEAVALFPLGPDQSHSFNGEWRIGDRLWMSAYTLETGPVER